MRDKIKRFCKEYIIDLNGTQAAIRTGYNNGKSAEVTACRHLQRPDVQEYISELKAKQSKRLEITADKVLEQYRRLAFADINDYYHNVYEIGHSSSSDKKYERTKRRVKRTYGSIISEAVYDKLPARYQHYYRVDKVLKPFDLLTKEKRAAIAGITYDKAGNPILKLSSKETSLDALAKHLGVFEKDNAQSQPNINVNLHKDLSDEEIKKEITKRGLPLHLMTSTS